MLYGVLLVSSRANEDSEKRVSGWIAYLAPIPGSRQRMKCLHAGQEDDIVY